MPVRAYVLSTYGGPEVLSLSETPDPEPGPEEVLVAIRAAGVNNSDLAQRAGHYPPPPPRPSVEIPGLEFAGEVVATGSQVLRHRPGDRVCGLLPGGGYAERVVTHERMAMPVPAGMSWVEAAAIPEVYLTAYDALFLQADLQPHEQLLVHAIASGVGTAALQLALVTGATVYGTSRSADKCRRVREMGAAAVIEMSDPDRDFPQALLAASGGRAMDVVLDLVGGAYLGRNLAALATRGRMVTLALKGGARAELDLGLVMAKRLRLSGSGLRARPLEEKIALSGAFARRCLPLFPSRLHPVVGAVLPWTEAAEAHRLLEASAVVGKVVLEVS
jgi:putative PIG3 family NAD(P)H quinone oxidoreductase